MIDTKLNVSESISNPIAIKRSVIELTNSINKELTTKYLASNNIKILIARSTRANLIKIMPNFLNIII
jgi:hypothetical protein